MTVRASGGGIATATIRWTVADAYGPIVNGPGWCVDNDSGRAVNGNKVQAYRCIGNAGQTWTVLGERITTQGKCLTASGFQEGDKVVLWDCDGRPEQVWRHDKASGALRNPASDRCLSGPANYQPLGVSACTGAPEQRWLLGQPL